ncbi:hypothetical protein PHLCEN_2v4005 [Hermanssonia centrifuga]|uniref:Dipeptidylpeptidase IV N-terminal domain-containing protein n=1 Tax=Hermanssonia centrifuga TaxID=98765 RepID=A0A2R6Q7F0_9APHY|nr:hypothetical protein PHLCEN_2v4005 [Hermanssonia centrifuga]
MRTTDYDRLPEEGDSPTSQNGSYPPALTKPVTYYGEGEFDPPSSDDEDEVFLEKKVKNHGTEWEGEGAGLLEEGELVVGGQKKQRPSSVRWLIVCLTALVSTAAVIGVFAALSYRGTSFQIHGSEHITMDHIFNGTFSAHSNYVRWIPEAGDGVFATSQHGHIALVDLKSNSTTNLVAMADVKDGEGNALSWEGWELSSDMKYMLIKSDYLKQWRHSSFGNYYVHDLTLHTTRPLVTPSYPPTTAYAKWSPTGQSIAFVDGNDLYVLPNLSARSPIRVTSSGNASLFHGVPDWVYEEEVFSGDSALWWSPDSARVAFLRFDETAVDEFTFPVYNPTEDSYAVVPYPEHVTMKYPKPGYNNPLVSVHVFELARYVEDTAAGDLEQVALEQSTLELTWEGRHEVNNSVIAEIAWVGNSTLIVKEVNRAATNGSVVLFSLDAGAVNIGRVVRKLGKDGEQGDDGWIEPLQAIFPIPASLSEGGLPAYLDIVPYRGYNHIALFSPATSSEPQFLTSGAWEVTDTILAVDPKRNLVYFQAANPSSIERHIYSIPLPLSTSDSTAMVAPMALTDSSGAGYFQASFSPQGGFYLLSYQGPNVPWQRIVQPNNATFEYGFTENGSLNSTLAQFELPVVVHTTMDSDGYDGRGTGLKGRRLRNPVKDNLGYWETVDQVNAAK